MVGRYSNQHFRKRSVGALLALLCCAIFPGAHADYAMNMPKGVTNVSQEIYDLHMYAIYACMGIGAVVFGVLLYSLIYHRKSRGAVPAEFHEHPVLEVVWAVIPLLILIGLAIPATRVLIKMEDHSKAQVNIKVVGYQWKWQYEYLDEGISFFSNLATPQEQIEDKSLEKNPWYLLEVDNPLVVPINQKIRLMITSNDVIHSWWVPELGVKKDGIPGFIHEAWMRIKKPGTYRGQCTELCGARHGFMPIVVIAKTNEDYQAWLAEKGKQKKEKASASSREWSMEELMTHGKAVYEKACAVCHKKDGAGMPPAFPGLLKSEYITGPIEKHIDIVVNGKTGTAMQAFGNQLSDDEIAAVVTYERNAWGNNMGDIVQPNDIQKGH